MKKSIKIATLGVAALGFAAAPALGASAADNMSVKDTLSVNVSSSCTFADVSPAGATGDGNAYSASLAPNATADLTAASGATSLKVTCNDPDGYTITPAFTGLTHQGSTTAASHDIAYSGIAVANGSQTWNALYSKNSGTAIIFSASDTAIEGTTTMTDTYTFSYKVGTGVNQAADTYKGTATYTLAAK